MGLVESIQSLARQPPIGQHLLRGRRAQRPNLGARRPGGRRRGRRALGRGCLLPGARLGGGQVQRRAGPGRARRPRSTRGRRRCWPSRCAGDELGRLSEELPLSTVLAVNFPQLARRLANTQDEVNGVIRLSCDGIRTIQQVMERAPIDELSVLAVLQRLLNEQVLLRREPVSAPKSKPSLMQSAGPGLRWALPTRPPSRGRAQVPPVGQSHADRAAGLRSAAPFRARRRRVRAAARLGRQPDAPLRHPGRPGAGARLRGRTRGGAAPAADSRRSAPGVPAAREAHRPAPGATLRRVPPAPERGRRVLVRRHAAARVSGRC